MKKVLKPFKGNYAVTQHFGVKVSYMRSGIHNGVDFGLPKGTNLIAAFDGEIVECHKWQLTGYGRDFKIAAPDGRTMAHYAHCSEILVANGTKVKRGEIIAKSGNTGLCISLRGGSGAHLHFGLMYDKQWINPLSYIDGYNLISDLKEEDVEPIKEEIKIEVKSEDVEDSGERWTVEKGDTLSKVAKAFLGNGGRWPEIAQLNRDIIVDANKIRPGMILKMPKK
jgi:hypothetical protein